MFKQEDNYIIPIGREYLRYNLIWNKEVMRTCLHVHDVVVVLYLMTQQRYSSIKATLKPKTRTSDII